MNTSRLFLQKWIRRYMSTQAIYNLNKMNICQYRSKSHETNKGRFLLESFATCELFIPEKFNLVKHIIIEVTPFDFNRHPLRQSPNQQMWSVDHIFYHKTHRSQYVSNLGKHVIWLIYNTHIQTRGSIRIESNKVALRPSFCGSSIGKRCQWNRLRNNTMC